MELEEANVSLLIGPLSIGVATCSDENQIFRQREAVALVSNIEAPLLASVWECDGGGVVFVCLWLSVCQFGFRLLCCCTSGAPL